MDQLKMELEKNTEIINSSLHTEDEKIRAALRTANIAYYLLNKDEINKRVLMATVSVFSLVIITELALIIKLL